MTNSTTDMSDAASSSRAQIEPGCKANLYLRILQAGNDGYHRIQSLFVPLSRPTDRILCTKNDSGGPGLVLTCSDPEIQAGQNSITTAYAAFARKTGLNPGLRVHLEKGVPKGSGLGGGSADAACILKYLKEQYLPDMPMPELLKIGLEVGSDVPFFFEGCPAWVSGIGERIQPVPLSLGGWRFLVVCPLLQVSTAWAYSAWDRLPAAEREVQKGALTSPWEAYKKCCSSGALVLYNDFEHVVFPHYPNLPCLKSRLLAAGMSACVMSGSGSALVAMTRDEFLLRKACSILEARQVTSFIH